MPLRISQKPAALVICFALAVAASVHAQSGEWNWELGGHYSLFNVPSNRIGCGGCRANNHGFGGNVAYHWSPNFGFYSELNFFPDRGVGATNIQGGRITQGLFGMKAGISAGQWSLFAKARPGFVSWGNALTGLRSMQPVVFDSGRVTYFATDLGGVIEYAPAPRFAIRVDVGDTIVRYNSSLTENNFQLGTGVVFHF